jgi:hypothetical protein
MDTTTIADVLGVSRNDTDVTVAGRLFQHPRTPGYRQL